MLTKHAISESSQFKVIQPSLVFFIPRKLFLTCVQNSSHFYSVECKVKDESAKQFNNFVKIREQRDKSVLDSE